MSSTTIHYINAQHKRFDDSLVRQSDLNDDRFVYSQCPVYNHKTSRVFIGTSPIDFKLKIDRTPTQNIIRCSDATLIEGDDEHVNSPRPVVQLKFPRFLFWTHDDDVWFEFNDHPMTSLRNNFIAVGGWFNLSNWSRNLSLAITLVDERKPVIIKKGDPLFRVSFYPSDLNKGINLSQEKDPTKIDYAWDEYIKKQRTGQQNKTWKPKLFSQTGESKCPFSFLFK
tara:strand:- start:30 stop:704 length:675 start_codon:yes stop_codon:yes gene_type:complete